jgi:hypothetical protein
LVTRQQKLSRQQEQRAAEDVGGQVQKGSGNQWSAKGDVRVPGKVRIECKVTEKDEYRLFLVTIQKIQREALRGMDVDWALQIKFIGPTYRREYAVISWNTAQIMGYTSRDITYYLAAAKSALINRFGVTDHSRFAIHWTQDDEFLMKTVVLPWSEYLARRDTE